MPHLSLLRGSRDRMLLMIEKQGDNLRKTYKSPSSDEFWQELEFWFKDQPVIRILTSADLCKERSNVRILKAKSRLIRMINRLITGDRTFLRDAT
jgi:hypothetical protein